MGYVAGMESPDVLIVTAVRDEFDAVLEVMEGAKPGSAWVSPFDPKDDGVKAREFVTDQGDTLRIVVTWAPEQGGICAVNTATRLFADLGKPRCLAMCGVCAGAIDRVALGDVIIAQRVWDYQSGKLHVEVTKEGERSKLDGEANGYRLRREWVTPAEFFTPRGTRNWLADRPVPISVQAVWFLSELLAGRDPTEPQHPERSVKCPQLQSVVERLRKRGHIQFEHPRFTLTNDGRSHIGELMATSAGKQPALEPFRVHLGPMVSGNQVVSDPEIFQKLKTHERNALGLEREAFAIGATAWDHGIPYMLVMKGVMDHANNDKDDHFKKFAARASAECLIEFLRKHWPQPKASGVDVIVKREPAAFDKGRRQLLGMIQGAILASIAGPGRNVDVVHEKTPPIGSSPAEETLRCIQDIFLPVPERVFLLPGEDNPNWEAPASRLQDNPFEVFTRTTLDAARAFARAVGRFGEDARTVRDLVGMHQAQGNLITFGSPTSNRVARIAMRYGEIGDGRKGCDYYPCDALDLKIRYELNGERIKESGASNRLVRRIVDGKEVFVPNWGMWTEERGIFCPEEENGHLLQDYLLISSLPNIFSRRSLDAGHRILNFGGTHREGTDSVKRLSEREGLLSELRAGIGALGRDGDREPFWQALILVECGPSVSSPTPVKVMRVSKVEVNETRLREMVDENLQLLSA